MNEKQRYDIQKRLKSYYKTDEIDTDLANKIHRDATRLLSLVEEYEKGIQEAKEMLFWGNTEVAIKRTYDILNSLNKY